jgi:hypothetical protein
MLTYAIDGPILEVKGDIIDGTRDVEAVLVNASCDPRLPHPTLVLIDMRTSLVTHSFVEVTERLSLIRQHTRAPFVALVVDGRGRHRLAHMYRTRGAALGSRIEVFSDIKSAQAWLVECGRRSSTSH